MTRYAQLSTRASKLARLLGIAILLLAGMSFGATTITLSTAIGPPTTRLQVSGGGFGHSAKINIFFDTVVQAAITANSSGSFSKITIQVPSSALPGNHTVKAVQSQGGTSARTTFLVRTDWAQFHRSNMQRWNQYENVLNIGNIGSLQLKWGHSIPGSIYTTPTVAEGVVYVASDRYERDGSVYALDASSGSMLWSYHMGTYAFWTSPAVANGLVYIGTAQGKVLALNASTGALAWTYATGSSVESPVTVVNGTVYFSSDNGNVYALNATTGAKLWSFATAGTWMASSPAVVNGIVYVGSSDNNVYALNASTGAKLWSYTAGNQVESSPAVANGVVYVGSEDGNLYALDANTGALIWLYSAGGEVYSSPAVANGVVYVGGPIMNALNATTGALLWTAALNEEGVIYSPAVANGVVYVTTYYGSLYAVDANTGVLLWGPSGCCYEVTTSPTVADGVVYFGSAYSMVYAFGLK